MAISSEYVKILNERGCISAEYLSFLNQLPASQRGVIFSFLKRTLTRKAHLEVRRARLQKPERNGFGLLSKAALRQHASDRRLMLQKVLTELENIQIAIAALERRGTLPPATRVDKNGGFGIFRRTDDV
jgi:hypothetical protein